MKKVDRSEILLIEEYENLRPDLVKQVIAADLAE